MNTQWKKLTLGELGVWSGGGTPNKSQVSYWENGTIPWISPKDMKVRVITKAKDYITHEAIEHSATKLYPKNSILIVTRSGILRTKVPVAKAGCELTINQDLKALKPNEQEVNSDYLLALLELNSKNILFACSKEGTTVESLDSSALMSFSIILPTLEEQKSIIQKIMSWDKAITQTQKLIEAKQKLKRGLMQQLLTGKARFPEYVQTNETIKTTFYTYSKDWSHVRISDIAWEISERNTEGEDLTVLSCSKYDGFVNSLAYFGKKVYSDDTSNYKVIQKSQFGFPSNHIEEGSIGLLRHIDKGIVSPIYTIFEVDQSKVTPEFLYLLLKTDTYRHIFSSRTSASVDRRGSLRWKEFSKIRVLNNCGFELA